MLYLFDLDGTLISSYMDTKDRIYEDWAVLPGRKEKIAELYAKGYTVAIVTNQRAVAFGYVTESQMLEKISQACDESGIAAPDSEDGPPLVFACCHDIRGLEGWNTPSAAARAKPSGAMILEAIENHPDAAADGVLFVGDRDEDQKAAANARVHFMWAIDFFREGE